VDARTVDWSALRSPVPGAPAAGLRERKRRELRQRLTDTATEMFLDRGFDAVRVAEIAHACGVSEKTVFNHFPTKEALLLDLPDATAAALRGTLADPAVAPLDAVLRVLAEELGALTAWLAAQPDAATATGALRRFGALLHATPSLRAYQREMAERLVAVAAEVLAQRTGTSPGDPEPSIAAIMLLGLWQVQFRAVRAHADGTRTPEQVHAAVTADVRRAARLVESGLSALPVRP
jgi:AcrR family transcriptional regulator